MVVGDVGIAPFDIDTTAFVNRPVRVNPQPDEQGIHVVILESKLGGPRRRLAHADFVFGLRAKLSAKIHATPNSQERLLERVAQVIA